MISKKEVKHIAKLARLELGTSSSQASTEKEIEKMQKDLSSILDYFDLLKKAPKVTKRQEASKKQQIKNKLRKDQVVENPASLANNLVEQAPDKKDGYLKVKSIL